MLIAARTQGRPSHQCAIRVLPQNRSSGSRPNRCHLICNPFGVRFLESEFLTRARGALPSSQLSPSDSAACLSRARAQPNHLRRPLMRHKLFALIFAITVTAWAQNATQTPPAQGATPEKEKPTCCDKMSDGKGAACMRHKSEAGAKEMASCCSGKDTSCCDSKKANCCAKDDKTAASCCKDGCEKAKAASCCDRKAGKECGKGCCGSNKSEKTA
jgi:hypothetical protein